MRATPENAALLKRVQAMWDNAAAELLAAIIVFEGATPSLGDVGHHHNKFLLQAARCHLNKRGLQEAFDRLLILGGNCPDAATGRPGFPTDGLPASFWEHLTRAAAQLLMVHERVERAGRGLADDDGR